MLIVGATLFFGLALRGLGLVPVLLVVVLATAWASRYASLRGLGCRWRWASPLFCSVLFIQAARPAAAADRPLAQRRLLVAGAHRRRHRPPAPPPRPSRRPPPWNCSTISGWASPPRSALEPALLPSSACLLGTAVGVLPGLGPVATIAMLLPLTFGLPPVSALIMLAGIYYGAQYGGSTTAILINLPGESSSVVTAIDGYQMAKQGRAGQALATAALGSFFAGTVATVILALFAPRRWPTWRSSSARPSISR